MKNLNHFQMLGTQLVAAAMLLTSTGSALAAVHYVDVKGTNATPPFTNWTTAATSIQDAVDTAVAGDVIIVTNGVYGTGSRAVAGVANRVVVDKALEVRSVNGPETTKITGLGGLGGRCVYLSGGASLSGFTLSGGQVNVSGGGAYGGTLNNCVLSNNRSALLDGGGGAAWCTLNNCKLSGNRAYNLGGGAIFCTLNNCILSGNSAADGGGAFQSLLNNCTLTGNSISLPNSPYGRGGARYCVVKNCIFFGNIGWLGNCEDCASPGSVADNNCYGDPLFVDQASGNLRLQFNSPCINAGENTYAVGITDLDGNPRIVRGIVDIGAYEFQSAVHYVDVNSTNAAAPFISWATAATNIQDAVGAAVAGDEIVVTNGIYAPISVGKPLMVRSVNGPQVTTVEGFGNYRCAFLTSDASLSGFTLAYGHVLNDSRGGAGAYGGTLNNCILTGNTASATASHVNGYGGGAAYCTLNNCTLISNSVSAYDGFASANGGGAYESVLNNCTVTGNSAYRPSGSGRFGGGAAYCTLKNCIVFANTASSGLGYGPDVYSCRLDHCWGADPLFADQAGGNLRLQSNSACINSGNSACAPAGLDLDGNPRIVGSTVDIGAYEYQSLDLIGSGLLSNQFGFTITGQSNWVIVLETSSDFTSWTPLATNTLSGIPFPFRDSKPTILPQRFYRARMQ